MHNIVLGEMLCFRSLTPNPSILRILFTASSLHRVACLHSSSPSFASPQRQTIPLHLIQIQPRKHRSSPLIPKSLAGRNHPHAPSSTRTSDSDIFENLAHTSQNRTSDFHNGSIAENRTSSLKLSATSRDSPSAVSYDENASPNLPPASNSKHDQDPPSAVNYDSLSPQKQVVTRQKMHRAVLEKEICLQLDAQCLAQKENARFVPESMDAQYLAQKVKAKDIVERLEKQGLPSQIASDILDAMPCSKRTAVNFEQLLSLVSFLQTMDMDTDKIPVLVRSAPFMYQRDPNIHLEPKIIYLESLGISRKDMWRLILKYPYSLYRPMEVIEAQIQFLRSLSLDEKHLQKIIKKSPLAFRLDAQSHLQPRLEFLQRLGLFPSDVQKAVLNNSRILSMTSDKLKKTADYLQTLGFKVGTEQLSKVILRCGSVTCETLQEGLKNLSEVGLSQQEVEMLLIRLPIVLSRKRADTNSKFKYLIEVMNRSPNEILACPVFLMLSLDKRIKPRYEALSQWKEENQVTKEYSLSYTFLPSDKVLSSRFPGINLKTY